MRGMSFPRAACALAFVTAVAACGGGGSGDDIAVVDAAVDVAIDAPLPIDGPPPCNGMVCDSVCVDTTSDEQHCGDCTTVCDPGEACLPTNPGPACICPPDFVPPDPSILQDMIITNAIPMTSIGVGGFIANEIDALIVAMPDASVLGTAYPLSGTNPGQPPFIGAGYDVDIATQQITAAYYATAGTVTFTARCTGGFAGHADGVVFSAASGLMPPMLVPGGCVLDGDGDPMMTGTGVNFAFEYGNHCP
jgi:hypothetical protein